MMSTTAITNEYSKIPLSHHKLHTSLTSYMRFIGTSGYFKYSEGLEKQIQTTRLHLNPEKNRVYTDFDAVFVGLKFKYFKGDLDYDYIIAKILIAHEIAHIRFTNKKAWDTYVYTAPTRYKKLSNFARDILNITEDGRIEYHMGKLSKFLRNGFYMLRQLMGIDIQDAFNKSIDGSKKLGALEKLTYIRSAILYMVCTRLLPSIQDEEIMGYLKQIYPYVTHSRTGIATSVAVKVTDKIMDILSPLRQQFDQEESEKMQGEYEMRSAGSYEPMEGEDLDEYEENTEGLTEDVHELPEELEEALEELSKVAGKELAEEDDSESSVSSNDPGEKKEQNDENSSDSNGHSPEEDKDKTPSKKEPEKSNNEVANQPKKSPLDDVVEDIAKQLENYTETLSKKVTEKVEAIQNSHEPITKDILEDFLHSTAKTGKQKILESKEELRIKELKAMFNQELHGKCESIFKNQKEINRFSVLEYNDLLSPLLPLINKTAKELSSLSQQKWESILRLQNRGKLDRRSLINAIAFGDDKIFKKKQVHKEKLTMDVLLLVDVSGSNSKKIRNDKNGVSLPRFEMNRIVSMVLHETLKKAKFQHAVWTFDEPAAYQEQFSVLVDFAKCFQSDTGMAFKDIGAYNSNRDGFAIAYAGEYLHRYSKSDKKLLLILSDGRPNAHGYGGESAMQDVKGVVEHLDEKGVKTISIFTGDESENRHFSKMYKNSIFANNESIFDLPETLKNLLISEFKDYLNRF